ncbi:SRPBCC family protein [Mycobacterium sp. 1245805.9]|uniref:SRPBCC family protein n=1 Tax=Mycobacterium sp. 1245805.9 TaxID=1856862 RepID=UPI000802544E|nr:SRPBCC family protein [Mycobacterium sp. 1245805.9]OBI87443.1 hypothetical protein A9X00_24335 [Mycobacterium sp. 1245805.9]
MIRRRARSRRLSESVRIAAPPDEVWELITRVAGITDWYDAWDAVQHSAGEDRLRVGTSFRLIRRRNGRDDTALCRVTSMQPCRRLCWVQYAPDVPAMSVEFELAAETDAGTLLSHTRSWLEPGGH